MKENKDDVFYTVIPDKSGARCDLCRFFQAVPGAKDRDGTCARVNGMIKRSAVCDLFVSEFLGSNTKRQG